MPEIKENLAAILRRIAEAEKAAGRPAGSVRLLAVSKTFPVEDVFAAKAAGQTMFGENKVQELEVKVPACPEVEWHLIGHLQSNKAAKAVGLVSWIHSVDSLKLLNRIAAAAEAAHKKINVLFEVNISGEESKFGLRRYEDVLSMADSAAASPWIVPQGLMTMAPETADRDQIRRTFAGLRGMRDSLERDRKIRLPELSMGMSGDFELAVAEGSTMVRVGTAIFGGRDYSK